MRWLFFVSTGLAITLAACGGPSPTNTTPAGIDATSIETLVMDIRRGTFGDVRSLLISRDDSPVTEYYFGSADRETVAPIYSVTKSVTSLLYGMAMAEGAIPSLDAPLATVLRSREALIRSDPRRERITMRDLLTMRAGIAWNEFVAPYDTPTNPVTQMLLSPDWIANVLERPMAALPGTSFVYSSGVTVVLGEAVHEATGLPLDEYARQRLLEPLGIPARAWHSGPQGVINAGGGLSLRSIDLMTLGRMVRNGGRVGSRQIVPEAWIRESLLPATSASLGAFYGFQWWLLGPEGPWDSARPVYAAIGWGGQLVLIFPQQGTVAVVTAANSGSDALVAAQGFVRRIAAALH